ncbi:MAG: type II toxin-antitoxin system VapC family toxin [Magnetococcales bacterium]|nr:type II toxin-antitoxin system VapC family toxin [Magnetococcales bacterium]
MKIVMDTHVFLWWIWNSESLSNKSREILLDEDCECYLSVASMWELSIKVGLGKLTLAKPLDRFLSDHMANNGFCRLDITLPHVAGVSTLPFHHRDPFDRLLISQAMLERMPILGADKIFDAYGVERLW